MIFLIQKGVDVAGVYLDPGTKTDIIPADAIDWLIECGAIVALEGEEEAPKKKITKGGK